jgi:hypothetical protein
MVGWLGDEDMPSLGGVAGGAGTTMRAGADSWTGERAAAVDAGRSEAEPGRECCWTVARELLLTLLVLALLRSNTVCLRMSDSLAITPRRRRNGMIDDHM